jgi:DNA-directed RNA polymerase specialized sigma24 family protein
MRSPANSRRKEVMDSFTESQLAALQQEVVLDRQIVQGTLRALAENEAWRNKMIGALSGVVNLPEEDSKRLRIRLIRRASKDVANADADELANDAFLVLSRRYAYVFDLTELVKLGMRITKHLISNRKRKIRSGGVSFPEDLLESPGIDALDHVIIDELIGKIARGDALGPRQVTILMMKLEGYSAREIARHEGIPEGSVNVLFFRAKRRLRRLLQRN